MGACCGQDIQAPSYKNMDSAEEQKFIDQQHLPSQKGAVLEEHLELFISCKNLPKMDLNSPSDPFIVISQKFDQDRRFHEIAKTEMVQDNNNPEFTKQIIISYKFEEVQLMRLDIYDADNKNLNNLDKHDYVGSCEFVLGDLVTSNNSKLRMKIYDKKRRERKYKKISSICIIRSEEIKTNHDQLMIQFSAYKLAKMTFMSKSNPYLQLYRQANGGGWMSIMRTHSFNKTVSPRWHRMKIPIQRLCNSDYSRPILIKCFHDPKNKAPKEIGQLTTSLQELLDQKEKNLVNIHKNNKFMGTLHFSNTEILKRYSFLEYIMGGTTVNMVVGIDFTGSNGDPKDTSSLHYCGPPRYESVYMRAIRSIGRVIESYDTDHKIPTYGFGANINPFGANKNISHCFNVTLTAAEEVDGVEGVLQAYTQALNKIQLYGPTNFSDIINKCATSAASSLNNNDVQNYTILLMITDGLISDMKQTIDAIVNASVLPLSIIIIGVGHANFSAMDKLDADDIPLISSKGVEMRRDIVQFVPFHEYEHKDISAIAKITLEEVPRQITEYYTLRKLDPIKKGSSLKQMETMYHMYGGPSKIVRSGTSMFQPIPDQKIQSIAPIIQNNQINQPIKLAVVNNQINQTMNQPTNPYYGTGGQIIQQTQPMNPNATNPSAPY